MQKAVNETQGVIVQNKNGHHGYEKTKETQQGI